MPERSGAEDKKITRLTLSTNETQPFFLWRVSIWSF